MFQNQPTGVTTRREVMFGAGAIGGLAFAESVAGAVAALPGRDIVPLPTPETIRRDYQRMVDFGPRLPGHPNHVRFVDFLAREFRQIGLTLGPCDSYAYRRWDPLAYGLDLEDDGTMKPVPNIAYYVRSHPAPPGGITAPLYYGGTIDKNGPTALGDVPAGSIVVFDGKLPQTTIERLVDPLYIHVPDADKAEYLSRPYKRLWLMPAFPLEAVLAKGAAVPIIRETRLVEIWLFIQTPVAGCREVRRTLSSAADTPRTRSSKAGRHAEGEDAAAAGVDERPVGREIGELLDRPVGDVDPLDDEA